MDTLDTQNNQPIYTDTVLLTVIAPHDVQEHRKRNEPRKNVLILIFFFFGTQ